MELFNIICGVCSIAGLLVSIFTASKVIKFTQMINRDDHSKLVNKNTRSTFRGDYTGRDSANGIGSGKQE